jgi:hypothetical protein
MHKPAAFCSVSEGNSSVASTRLSHTFLQGTEHTPIERRPEATFLPTLVDHFLTLLDTVVAPPVATTTTTAADGAVSTHAAKAATNGATNGSSSDESDDDDAEAAVGDEAAAVALADTAVDVGDALEREELRGAPLRIDDLPEGEAEEAAPGAPGAPAQPPLGLLCL